MIAGTEEEGIERLHTLESVAAKWAQYEGQLDDISAWVHHTKETIETGPAKMSMQQQLHMHEVCDGKFVLIPDIYINLHFFGTNRRNSLHDFMDVSFKFFIYIPQSSEFFFLRMIQTDFKVFYAVISTTWVKVIITEISKSV